MSPSPGAPPSESLRPTVWVLDDSPAETEAVRRALSPSCQLLTFSDGAALLESLGQQPAPEVLVMDWFMPSMVGAGGRAA